MKEKNMKGYSRRTRLLLETKIYCRNLIKRKNTWAVPLVWYSWRFLKWTKEELKQTDQRTRKLIIMFKALHSRDDVVWVYVSRKEGGRGLAGIEDSVDTSIQRLRGYIENCGRRRIKTTKNNTDNTRTNRTIITIIQKWEENNTMNALSN